MKTGEPLSVSLGHKVEDTRKTLPLKQDGRRKVTPKSCSLTFTYAPCHVRARMHIHNNMNNNNKTQLHFKGAV